MINIHQTAIQDLPRISKRATFLYVERCRLHREDSALTIADKRGVAHIPAAQLACIMCGPGAAVTTAAISLMSETGVTCVWVGENGIRMYAAGRGLSSSSALAETQARLVSNRNTHLDVARKMFNMRFHDVDVSRMTMRDLRLAEARRVKDEYRSLSQRYGVKWSSRKTKVTDDMSDINVALNVGNSCMYGVAHATIVALGAIPSLGFVHVGHAFSFVFDIADLYKAEIIWPIAFQVASDKTEDVTGDMRRKVRDSFRKTHIIDRIVHDIYLLLLDESRTAPDFSSNVSQLWSDDLKADAYPDVPIVDNDTLLTDNGIVVESSIEW